MRNRKLHPDDLDTAQSDLYDTIVNGARAGESASQPLVDDQGRLEGPFNAFLLRPVLGQALQKLGATLRYHSALEPRSREVAILVVAAHKNSKFEQYIHEPIARSVTLSNEQITGIRSHVYDTLPPAEQAVACATAEMLLHGDLDESAFEELAATLGAAGIFELTALVGYYELLALQMRVFRVTVPSDRELPDRRPFRPGPAGAA